MRLNPFNREPAPPAASTPREQAAADQRARFVSDASARLATENARAEGARPHMVEHYEEVIRGYSPENYR